MWLYRKMATKVKLVRCEWPGKDEAMIKYHDTEWGTPLHNDELHFEYIVLDTFQAGLSWLLMIRKRENFRRAFDDFNPKKIARFDEKRVAKLMSDAGIVRNNLKIRGTVANARAFLEVQKEFGSFDKYIWQFVNGKTIVNKWGKVRDLPAVSVEAVAMSKDMKKRGFKFVGPTVCYAYMQGAGLVNDHMVTCFRHVEVQRKK